MNEQASRKNTRRSRRQTAKSGTKLRAYRNPLGLGPNIGLRTLDISETGLRLILKEELPVGHSFEVEIEGPSMKPFKAVAILHWILKAEDGTFIAGASFDKALAYSHLTAMVR